jgi:hypothetical protein
MHLFEDSIYDGGQSFPKVAYRLAGHKYTFASRIATLGLRVTCHGSVELDEIEEVNGISYGPNIVVKPARDSGGAELYTI